MGRKMILTGTKLSNLAAPVLQKVDPIESAGSLLLVEPMHPYESWAAGVPASNSTVKNLLGDTALSIVGGGATLAQMNSTLISSGLTAAKGLVERTTKGGLHGIISPTAAQVNTDGLQLLTPLAIYNWMKATAYAHNFYVSLWTNHTRVSEASAAAENLSFGQIASGGGFVSMFTNKGHLPGTATTSRPETNVAGPDYRNVQSVPGTTFRDSSEGASHFLEGNHAYFNVGNRTTAGATAARMNKAGSHIFYRAYVEDLTISGRSYAAVDAIDYALYSKHVLTVGGRYYSDTFTSPTTIP